MEMKDVFEDQLGFLGSGILQVDPEEEIGVAEERGHEETLQV